MNLKLLIVTPARNEACNLLQLLENLQQQEGNLAFEWIIVVNNSTDETLAVSRKLRPNFPLSVLEFHGKGNMSSVAEYQAFFYGADEIFMENSSLTHIMKLDADIRLQSDYFKCLFAKCAGLGILGGPLEYEQLNYVPGGAKIYSRAAFQIVRRLPIALGIDVLDEIAVKKAGLEVEVEPAARFSITRKTASSEGMLKGRWRNGKICRWSGYSRFYFLLHLIRYSLKSPYITGAMAMSCGYMLSGRGPFDSSLRIALRSEQRAKVETLLRNPIQWIRRNYHI